MQARPARLLIIDDDCYHRTILSRQLSDAGYDVMASENGHRGFKTTRSVEPDLVLCDWMMPGMDGIEYCRAVRSNPETRGIYVILLTARGERRDRVRGLDAGADDFLMKPTDSDELLARVRAGLRIHRLQAEMADSRHHAALIEFAATLGHEINNPLTALLGHLELLVSCVDRGDLTRAVHHVEGARDASHRVAQVAQQLVSLRGADTKTYLGDQRMLDLENG